jgi:hypothetical protein
LEARGCLRRGLSLHRFPLPKQVVSAHDVDVAFRGRAGLLIAQFPTSACMVSRLWAASFPPWPSTVAGRDLRGLPMRAARLHSSEEVFRRRRPRPIAEAKGPWIAPDDLSSRLQRARCSAGNRLRCTRRYGDFLPLSRFTGSPLRRSTVGCPLPGRTRGRVHSAITPPSVTTRSVHVVSHHFDGFLHPRLAGLLHPASDHEVRRISGFRGPDPPRWPWPSVTFPATLYPSKSSPRPQPHPVTGAVAFLLFDSASERAKRSFQACRSSPGPSGRSPLVPVRFPLR